MAGLDLETLKEIFRDTRSHIAIAKIKKLSVAEDRSFLKCLVSIFPEQREVVARMSWPMTGPEAGIIEFPEVEDLVLIAFADGENDYAFVISRLTSSIDKLPLKAIDGHLVLKSKSGKQIWLTSSNKILISKGDTEPTENLVLGQELKTLLVDILAKLTELSGKCDDLSTEISQHTHAGNLGYPTSPPNQAASFVQFATDFNGLGADFDDISSSPVQDEIILSDIAFTEKGN